MAGANVLYIPPDFPHQADESAIGRLFKTVTKITGLETHMNTSATETETSPVAASAATEGPSKPRESEAPAKATAAQASSARSWGLLAWLTVLLLALAGVVLSASLWVRMNNVQSETARHVGDVMAQQRQRQTQADDMLTQLHEVQARLASAEARVSELSLQRTQMEELVRGLSRSRDESLVQDLESSIRQAMASAELSGSVQPLVAALQVGVARIARAPQPRLNPVQEAMAQDLTVLQQADVLNVPQVVMQLSVLSRSLDRLPMGMPPAQRPSEVLGSAPQDVPMPLPADAAFWQRWQAQLQRAWGQWWHDSQDLLHGLVRVRRIDQPDAIALTPEQAMALSSQLKLRLLSARVALLNGQREVVAADLKAVRDAVNAFAQLETTEAQAILTRLEDVRQALSRQAVPRPTHTLQALALAASS